MLADHVRHVIADAGLDLGEEAVAHVVRQGGGSARDTLSALDQVAAMGGVVEEGQPIEAILDALVVHDAGAVLVAVAAATEAGREPRALGEALIARLRDGFLAVMGAPDRQLPAADLDRAAAVGGALGPAGLTRALEVLGEALVELSKKPDPRIVLEVALVRLCRPDADRSLDAVLDRLERLERASADGGAPPAATPSESGGAAASAPAPAASVSGEDEPASRSDGGGRRSGPADEAREELAKASVPRPSAAPARARVTKATAAGAAAPPRRSEPLRAAPADTSSAVPSRDELTLAWGDHVLDALPRGTKAIYSTGRFVDGDGSAAVFALANAPTRDHCEKKRTEVEAALAAHFGRPVPIRLVTDADVGGTPPAAPKGGRRAAAPPEPETEEAIDVSELEDAPAAGTSAERLADAFPGAELIEEP